MMGSHYYVVLWEVRESEPRGFKPKWYTTSENDPYIHNNTCTYIIRYIPVYTDVTSPTVNCDNNYGIRLRIP